MKLKVLIILAILSSLFGYLEWGGENYSFLYQIEFDILGKLFSDPASVIHPFIIIPLIGQVLLLISLFQKEPNSILVYSGLGCLTLLLGFMLFIGALGTNLKIILSTLPFLVLSVLIVLEIRKRKHNS